MTHENEVIVGHTKNDPITSWGSGMSLIAYDWNLRWDTKMKSYQDGGLAFSFVSAIKAFGC